MADKRVKLEITAKNKTKAVFRSVQQGLSKLGGAAKGVGIAIGVASVAAGVLIKKMADSIDATGKMARVLGVTIKELETFKLAADLGGTSMETFTKGAKQLSAASFDFVTKGTGAAADAFKVLGISVAELKPLMNDQVGLMGLVSDRLNALPNGALKTATAYKLFGSRGTALINVLEGGSKALKEIARDTERFGLALSNKQVLAVEKANDEFTRLFAVVTGISKQITGELFPKIGLLATELREKVLVAIEDSFGSVQEFSKFLSQKISGFVEGASLGLVKAAKALTTGFLKFGGIALEFLAGFLGGVDTLVKSIKTLVDDLADFKKKGILSFLTSSDPDEVDNTPFGRAMREFEEKKRKRLAAQFSGGGAGFDPSSPEPVFVPPPKETESALLNLQKRILESKETLDSTTDTFSEYFDNTTDWIKNFGETQTKVDEVNDVVKEGILETNVALDEEAEKLNIIENALRRVEGAGERAGQIIANGFEQAIFKAKSFEEALGSIADQLLKLVFQQTVTQPLAAAIGSFFTPAAPAAAPAGGGGGGGFGGGADANLIAGNGAAMSFGRLEKFARGGVVSRPTTFPMRGGKTGLMGEAGQEGILPLRRGRNGQLGVISVGGGKGAQPAIVNVNVVDQRKGGREAEVTEGTDQNGNKQISVMIRDEVKKGFAEGAFDRNLKVFGLNRGGIGRV
jgi:hypothetical protein